MGKDKRPEQINTRIDQQYGNINSQYADLLKRLQGEIDTQKPKYDQLFDTTSAGIQGMIPRWQELADKGYGQSDKFNRFGDEIAAWARNSVSDTDKNRIRGNGLFEEFAKTGGWDDAQRKDYLGQIASSTPRFYANLKENLGRQNLASGGINPGYGSQTSKLARDAAFGTSDAIRSGRISMADAINKGRMWGGEQMSSSEQALQELLGKNYIGGMGVAGDQYRSGLVGLGLAQDALQGESGSYDSLRGLYGTTPGYADFYKTYGGALGDQNSAINNLLGRDIENNPRKKPWWQTALDFVGPIASSAVRGGIGGGGTGQGGDFMSDYEGPFGGQRYGMSPDEYWNHYYDRNS